MIYICILNVHGSSIGDIGYLCSYGILLRTLQSFFFMANVTSFVRLVDEAILYPMAKITKWCKCMYVFNK